MRLVYESAPFGDSPGSSFTFTDLTPDTLRDGYANLYTNELTGEGILQANDKPPFAKDVDVYRNSLFYANTRTRHTLDVNLLGVSDFINSSLTITSIGTGASPTITTATSHGLETGDNVAIFDSGTTPDLDGEYEVTVTGATTFTVTPGAAVTVGSSQGVVFPASLVVTRNTSVNRFYFVGRQETWEYISGAGAGETSGNYFLINSADDSIEYYVWLNVDAGGGDPNLTGKVGIEVAIASGDSDTTVATKIETAIEAFTSDFNISRLGATLTITTSNAGTTSLGSTPFENTNGSFTGASFVKGIGEDTTNNYIKISYLLLAEQQIDDMSRSMVRVINQSSSSDIITGRYVSTATDAPGQMNFESRVFDEESFTMAINGPIDVSSGFVDGLGDLFDPTLPELIVGTAVDNSGSSTVTMTGSLTTANFGLSVGNTIKIEGEDGFFEITSVTATTFDITTSSAITGTIKFHKTDVISSNEEVANRLYFSKFQQPDAVPSLNFIDIGPKDKAILRIQALRDSLFVFKEDGIYRVSGTIAPNFSVQKFDTSILIAPDTVATLNNQIYALASQGVISVTETGVGIISRDIENIFTNISTDNFPNFRSSSFGVGYEKDRAYIQWTVSNKTDTFATKAYRYNTFTQTWTEWTVNAKCAAVVEFINDAGTYTNRLYIGAADDNIIEEERKSLTRADFVDREFDLTIPPSPIKGDNTLLLNNTSNVSVGDAIVQTQYLTPYEIRKLSLRLALDSGMQGVAADITFYQTFEVEKGDALDTKMTELVTQINSDLGTAFSTSFSTDFATIQTEFNTLIGDLNSDATLIFANYETSTGTLDVEMIAKSVDINDNTITGDLPLFVPGPVTHFQGIKTDIIYAPMMFQDPSMLKHVREATMLFEADNIDIADMSYNTDLSPGFESVMFSLEGSGVWGLDEFETTTWGGEGTAAPFRTLIPRQKQRCRFIRCRFEHSAAFNKYRILGLSYVYKMTSSRAYR